MEALISVIVPVYNVEKYLDRCIISIAEQTYRNIEIILVDDGSEDNCPEICDKWAKEDDRIRVIHKENGGLSSARNAGLDVCQGDYIAFVDSDDYASQTYLERLALALESSGADMSMCGVEKVYEDTGESEHTSLKTESLTRAGFFDNMQGYGGWCWVVAWNKLYKRKLFDDIRYPVGRLYEDDYVIAPLIYKSDNIAVIEDELYYYVQRKNSIISGGYTYKKLQSGEIYSDRCLLFIENNEPTDRLDFCLKLAVQALYTAYENNLDDKEIIKEFIRKYRLAWRKARGRHFGVVKHIYYAANCCFPKLVYKLRSKI